VYFEWSELNPQCHSQNGNDASDIPLQLDPDNITALKDDCLRNGRSTQSMESDQMS
jgi:hypothetical protein